MGQPILFFFKNKADISNPNVTFTASEGNTFAPRVGNRSNRTGWITTGSTDASGTTFEVDLIDARDLTDIILVKQNFKDYTIKKFDGVSFVDFTPAISVTGNTLETKRHEVTKEAIQKILITITATMVADDDKIMSQLILTEKIGQLVGFPEIKKPTISQNRKRNRMLSGKFNINQQVGGFSMDLKWIVNKLTNDLTIIEDLYNKREGFLVWPSGGDEDQFLFQGEGYRLEDIFLMKTANEYRPELRKSLYVTGYRYTTKLVEVVD